MKAPPVRMEVSREEFEDVLARVRETLGEPDDEKLKAAIETLANLTDLVQDREISLQRLRKILFGASTEKTRDVTPASPNPNPTLIGPAPPGNHDDLQSVPLTQLFPPAPRCRRSAPWPARPRT
jgi:hypothetical protein